MSENGKINMNTPYGKIPKYINGIDNSSAYEDCMIHEKFETGDFSMSIFNSSQLEEIAGELNEDSSQLEEELDRKIWRSSKPKKPFNGYNHEGKVYNMDQMNEFLEVSFENAPLQRSTSRLMYYNVASSFDIETTSFYLKTGNKIKEDGEEVDEVIKQATMYVWQFGINGYTIIGRTWFEFAKFLSALVNHAKLNSNTRLIVYVHNLSFEFQFIKEWFKWDKVFSMKNRRPVVALTGGIEFRCSYYLSNYNLAYLGENLLTKYPVKKLVGNLDYNLIRHCETPLTQDEIDYAVNDVRVVMSYIQEKIENEGGIAKIPLTNTGYVRNHCREVCFANYENATDDERRDGMNYKAIIKSLRISSFDEYRQLKDAFMGGFTHASVLHSNKVLHNLDVNVDEASAYPAQMVYKYFPMSSSIYIGKVENSSQLEFYLKNYCCLFDLYIENIRPLVEFENILSISRCKFLDKDVEYVANNGRLVSYAGCLKTTVTELDYANLMKFYDWDGIYINNLRLYKRGYLPTLLVKAILDFYSVKTSKKDVPGHETEYMVSKNMLNSSFGMMVTDIIRDLFTYDEDGWGKEIPDGEKSINSYNKNFNRFLFYPWGVWVTAHARDALFSAIYELGEDYVYADTDSCKGFNWDKHKDWFERYNINIKSMAIKSSARHGIPLEMYMPKTKKGKEKLLGIWEQEKPYETFKTCGAKRYMYEQRNDSSQLELSMTVAGVNKKTAIKYLKKTYGDTESIYEIFSDGMFIPASDSGKLTHTYIDEVQSGRITDYLGKTADYYERSSIHLEPASFTMSQLPQYIKLLEGVEEIGTFQKY